MVVQLVNFVVERPLLMRMDKVAKKRASSRSQLIRTAIKGYLDATEQRQRDFAMIRKSGKRVNLMEDEAIRLVDEIRDQLPMNQ